MAVKKARRPPRKKPASPQGLPATGLAGEPPSAVAGLGRQVEAQGGAVLARYRDPWGGNWVLLVALPIDRVEPTPYQRDPSPAHVERIARVMEKVGRFLDPIILSPGLEGSFYTPNGNHRLQALRKLGAQCLVGLLVPEPEVAHQILALNTEKGYNLREKSLGVLKLLRALAERGGPWAQRTEESLAFEIEEPALIVLGLAYERKPRFSGGAYHSVLRRVEAFIEKPLRECLKAREARAARLLEVDEAVSIAIAALKDRGFQSPYLRPFVVARINPIRFHKGDPPPADAVLEKMLRAAERFDAAKVRETDIARSGGPPAAEE